MTSPRLSGKRRVSASLGNQDCTGTGRIEYVGPIFPGTHNDKTMVWYDKLVDNMRNDPVFKECEMQTCVPDTTGGNTMMTGCITL